MLNKLNDRSRLYPVVFCCINGCNRKQLARGYCQTHYAQLRKAGSESVAPRTNESDAEYIRRRVQVLDSGCWKWLGSSNSGYGKLMKRNKNWMAHVFSFVAHGNCLPEGMQVNHKCHNRWCVNPQHLYAGTQVQNMADMAAAGRRVVPRGEKNGMAKLTREAAMEVYLSNGFAREIAAKFGISMSLVLAIKKKLIWRHIHE